ncbi:hypothetical protein RB6910 [Rhodopirellula baltica SH 1]|uniref:Uncharacterized protein n=1 Tax=Rhodopirellula baltica (strain DSM 10527 / NCIMB 13988 / SH1) TaxID=243090 RepID=Q7UPI8_RHOBA|nr:hypothetical protein RB6910 [Rhodopirellula baltica SH 1]
MSGRTCGPLSDIPYCGFVKIPCIRLRPDLTFGEKTYGTPSSQ